MGLLTIIRKRQRKALSMRILMLGLDNAGKTTILKRICGLDIDSVSPTLGFNIKTLVHRGYSLNIWDVGGQRSLRPYWSNYFGSTDALIWVVDAADKLRVADCRDELHFLLQEERLQGASLLVLANKQDIRGSLSSEEIAALLQLDQIKTHQWQIQPSSARTGQNLLVGFDWVVHEISQRLYHSTTSLRPRNPEAVVGLQSFDTSEQQAVFQATKQAQEISGILTAKAEELQVPPDSNIPSGRSLSS